MLIAVPAATPVPWAAESVDDGDVLVIEVDGKCPPTATEAELAKRRGKRKLKHAKGCQRGCQRHRGVAERTANVQAFEELPLTDKFALPAKVSAPDLAVLMVDGGRIQILDRSESAEKATPDVEPPPATNTVDTDGDWQEENLRFSACGLAGEAFTLNRKRKKPEPRPRRFPQTCIVRERAKCLSCLHGNVDATDVIQESHKEKT
jgi:hypothetical protein